MDIAQVRADLLAEQAALDEIVASLSAEQWARATRSPGWTVADQIGHLAYFDKMAALAIIDPDGFPAEAARHWEAVTRLGTDSDNFSLASYRALDADQLLSAWRSDRDLLAAASRPLADDARVPWYGPSMGAKSFLTARLMEAWAHGQDIVDAVGTARIATDRLQHIARLGFNTRGWSYVNRSLEASAVAVRVELVAPSGARWRYGPDEADESVVGPAEDFCLVVTQRRHVDDTSLQLDGPAARDWMLIAQAFAGNATDGPERRTS